jgi:hypothetical protein
MHPTTFSRQVFYSRWSLPAFSLLLGLVIGAAQWKGGDLQTGATSLALFVVIAAVLFLGGRSETIRMIRGDGRDERWARIDLTATALSGLSVITAVIIGAVWEWAHGRDGTPFVQLGAIGGLVYIASLAILRKRS